jgi:hypothetical protein
MKRIFIGISIFGFIACNNNNPKKSIKENSKIETKWSNKYEVYDEPSSENISELRSYFLLVSEDFMDSLRILSIREDSNSIQGFYKRVPYMEIPPLFPNMVETKTFMYSTIRFLLDRNALDSIRHIIKANNLFSLRDTVKTNGTDGSIKELIIYDHGKLNKLEREYGFEKDVEPQFLYSFKQIMKFAPAEPVQLILK